jgi:FtsZ-interacting cell division protein ZipA
MRKTILIIISIMLLLLIAGLNTSKLNHPATNETEENTNVNTEIIEETETTNMESTKENTVTIENKETSTNSKQPADEKNTPEENNKQTTFTNENTQTLQNPSQSASPPDGRIYYPSSSEESYAYTPTYTPKATNMPIIPLYPEN